MYKHDSIFSAVGEALPLLEDDFMHIQCIYEDMYINGTKSSEKYWRNVQFKTSTS